MKVAYLDGASKGNPGPASIGIICYVDETEKEILFQVSEKIGHATNNIAEWTSLLRLVEELVRRNILESKVYMDSELVVKQFKGEYKTKNTELQKIKEQVLNLKKDLENLQLIHVKREKNKVADKLANEAFK